MLRKLSSKKGFTIIEVSLFLAITGLMLAGILTATWGSIARQRANDIVQDFTDFLTTQYSTISNVQSTGTGNSNRAIYGKVITFGEQGSNENVFTYDLIGDVLSSEKIVGLTIPQMLKAINADVVLRTEKDAAGSNCDFAVLNQNTYTTNYGGNILATDGNNFTGTIIILRSPSGGTVHTYFVSNFLDNSPMPINVQQFLKEYSSLGGMSCTESPFRQVMEERADGNYGVLKEQDINFCLASQDVMHSRRYNIRINKGAHNSTGVEIIKLDDEDNKCEH